MRVTVYEKLCAAQKSLPNGFKFILHEGYRSLEVQQMLFEAEYKKISEKHLSCTHEGKFHKTTRLVSPIINLDGSRNIPHIILALQ